MPAEAVHASRLDGLGVLVTRPARQSGRLADAIEAAGGRAVCFAAIEIVGPLDVAEARRSVARAGDHDAAIFVSANAVEAAMAMAASLEPAPRWPTSIAVGPATHRALERHGVELALMPRDRFDSAGVLGLDVLAAPAVRGRRVLIVRGEGGREAIATELSRRGAEVHQVAVYRRAMPGGDREPLRRALIEGQIGAAVVTSAEAAHNLFELAGTEAVAALRALDFVVLSDRIAAAVEALGVARSPYVAGRAEDAAVVAALEAIRARSPAR